MVDMFLRARSLEREGGGKGRRGGGERGVEGGEGREGG